MTRIAGIAALATLAAAPALAFKMPDLKKPDTSKLECNDDHGLEKMGQDMDDKAYKALISAETARADVQDALGKKDDAGKTRDKLKTWADAKKAPTGSDRMKEISAADADVESGATEIANKTTFSDAEKTGLKGARWELRRAVLLVAWGAKIGKDVPDAAKAATDASKACASKAKGPTDAAAALTTTLAKLKSTYSAVDGAAKKAGNAPLTDAEQKQQAADVGIPADLGV